MFLSFPQYVTKTVEKLQANGFKAYAVGGCVRDMLMGKTPHDYDVTTDALPETVEKLFEKTVPTGIKHGTVTVLTDGGPIEVTTFRTETGYTDSRRPDSVSFVGDLKEDLARRDFTVNAICCNPTEGIIDLFGGQDDIKNGILRAVGEPERRFKEDALRILRLFRFAAQLGFMPETETHKAALKLSDSLQKISRERIAAELERAVCGGTPTALEPLLSCGALRFLGISAPCSLEALSLLPPRTDIRLAAFIYLCDTSAERLSSELKLSNALREYLIHLEKLLSQPYESTPVFIKRALRNTGEREVRDLLYLRTALFGDKTTAASRLLDSILSNGEPYSAAHLTVGGSELKRWGFSGKEIGRVLQQLVEAVTVDPTLNTPEKLKEIAKKLS